MNCQKPGLNEKIPFVEIPIVFCCIFVLKICFYVIYTYNLFKNISTYTYAVIANLDPDVFGL